MSLNNNSNKYNLKKTALNQTHLSSVAQKTLGNLKKVINKKTIEALAKESKLLQRVTSKIMGFPFLVAMLVARLDAEHATLEKISDVLHSIDHRIKITPQSIMERLNSPTTTHFFKMIFENILKTQLDDFCSELSPDLLGFFKKVLIQDSTSIELNEKLSEFFKGSGGRASKSSAKIDVIYDFKAKKYEHITITDHRIADQVLSFDALDFLSENSLIIRDLGYLRADCIVKIQELGAFFLSRIKNNMSVYLNKEDSTQFDLAEYLLKKCKNKCVIEMNVYLTKVKVPVRLIAYRAPQHIVDERRRKAHATAKKQGRTLTKKSLALLDFSIFITNVPKEIWPAEVVGTIYRLRWQIEILYKSWKSGLNINYLKGINSNRIKSLLYIGLIMSLIVNEIYKLMIYVGSFSDKVVSMFKVYNWMKSEDRLKRVLNGKFSWWEEKNLTNLVSLCMSKQKRKDRKTSLEAIQDHEFYYQEAR